MVDISLYQTVFVVVCFWSFWLLWDNFKNRKRWKMLSKVPGFKPIPLLGNLLNFGMKNLGSKENVAKLFQFELGLSNLFHKDGVNVLWIFRTPFIVLTRATTVEAVLSSQDSLDKGAIYNMGSPWLGNGLPMSSGDKWRRDRKKLTPAFHFRLLGNFLPIMNEQAAILVQKFENNPDIKKCIDPLIFISMCTTDIICESAMGVKIGAQEKMSSYVHGIINVTDAISYRLFRPWLHSDLIYYSTSLAKEFLKILKGVHDFTNDLIEMKLQKRLERFQDTPGKLTNMEIMENYDDNSKKKLAFLDLIIESDMNKDELRDQVNTFVFAGLDTTASTLTWILYVLGLEPEVQSRLAAEVYQVLGEEGRDVTLEDLKDLKYMDCVMKEVQRIYATVPNITRMLSQDTKIGDYTIPKGTECVISISSVHRDPEIYPDPERFDPDRFKPENCLGRNPYAFIPFSAGPRNCIGQRFAVMEMKIILCHIVRKFVIKSLDQRDVIMELPELVLAPAEKLRIQFTSRIKMSSLS